MWEMLSRLSGSEIVIVAVVLIVCCCRLAWAFAAGWLRHRQRELAAGIIQELLDQGVAAEQIERVLAAAGFDQRVIPSEKTSRKG